MALEVFIIYTVFAVRSLSSETMKIYVSLVSGDIDKARKQVSFLVSRDTDGMERGKLPGGSRNCYREYG
jgi:adenosylcobinamide-phosphate synthase